MAAKELASLELASGFWFCQIAVKIGRKPSHLKTEQRHEEDDDDRHRLRINSHSVLHITHLHTRSVVSGIGSDNHSQTPKYFWPWKLKIVALSE